VTIRNGQFSTTALSQGQRKGLALMTAYLEDRPFYLFDEWAADQDPHFKEIFYTQLLPELRSRVKSVLVITHDDKYFGLADRIVKLDYGKIVQDAAIAISGSSCPRAPNPI
jgi:putative ATP-binding cassette transporter